MIFKMKIVYVLYYIYERVAPKNIPSLNQIIRLYTRIKVKCDRWLRELA